MPKKALLIVNPAAGPHRLPEGPETLRAALGPLLAGVAMTGGPGDAEQAAREASARGFDAIFVAGGDGTLNEVVNGLMAADGDPASLLPVGLIPQGTQNVLAHELGLPHGDLAATVALLRAGRTRRLDVGKAGGRHFLLMAGFGFDALVVREVLRPMKTLIGPAAYAFATLGALAKCRSTSLHLHLDDEEIQVEAYLVVVANAASYAYRQIKMAPFAALDDGWLDVCVFERPFLDRVGFATQMMAVVARRHLRDPRVRYYRARRVRLESDPPMSGQIDGDISEETPLEITLSPRALPVFVP